MKFLKALLAPMLALSMMGAMVAAPTNAQAQSASQLKHRQQQKNQWRNIGIGSAAVGLLGLLKHDNTLMFAGAAGALYSANRYEQDRRSQSRMQRARAAMFSKKSYTRNGQRYVRHTTYKNGKKYYYFKRG